jgi:hypothetical protein
MIIDVTQPLLGIEVAERVDDQERSVLAAL